MASGWPWNGGAMLVAHLIRPVRRGELFASVIQGALFLDSAVQRCPSQPAAETRGVEQQRGWANNTRHGEEDGEWSDVHHRCHHPPDVCVPAHTHLYRTGGSGLALARLGCFGTIITGARSDVRARRMSVADGGFEKRRAGTGVAQTRWTTGRER